MGWSIESQQKTANTLQGIIGVCMVIGAVWFLYHAFIGSCVEPSILVWEGPIPACKTCEPGYRVIKHGAAYLCQKDPLYGLKEGLQLLEQLGVKPR